MNIPKLIGPLFVFDNEAINLNSFVNIYVLVNFKGSYGSKRWYKHALVKHKTTHNQKTLPIFSLLRLVLKESSQI